MSARKSSELNITTNRSAQKLGAQKRRSEKKKPAKKARRKPTGKG
jgi:hypothetical protein